MDYQHILLRIRAAVRRGSYLVPTGGVPPAQRAALRRSPTRLRRPTPIRSRSGSGFISSQASGRIDHVMKLSALGVLAASPLVGDLAEAARLASQQEFAALEPGARGATCTSRRRIGTEG